MAHTTNRAHECEKVPHRAGDVGLGFELGMPPQCLRGAIAILGVVRINVQRNSAFYPLQAGH